MIWADDELKSPFSGERVRRDSPHSFSDGVERFPVIAEIPFLRAGRNDLKCEVLKKLDAGDERGALIELLRDQDDWAKTEPPGESDLNDFLTIEKPILRDAMRVLNYGAVADYFAYRWSDPTFLSGLKLLETHLPNDTKKVFELCCGIGHYLREFTLRGIAATGADVVFSKLWLARKFVAPEAKLICFDANFDFPFSENSFDAAFCHDAFYFLPEKKKVAGELKRTTCDAILIGHAHNSQAENYSSGAAISANEYAAMFENATLYDDAELTKAFVENSSPKSATIAELEKVEAVSLTISNAEKSGGFNFDEMTKPENLRINPLFENDDGKINRNPKYPSERYENEYAALSGYLFLTEEQVVKIENSGIENLSEAEIKDLTKRKILLNLPQNW